MNHPSYRSYTSYNMRTFFSRAPGDILTCPMCPVAGGRDPETCHVQEGTS